MREGGWGMEGRCVTRGEGRVGCGVTKSCGFVRWGRKETTTTENADVTTGGRIRLIELRMVLGRWARRTRCHLLKELF